METRYKFMSIEKLVADFLADVERVNKEHELLRYVLRHCVGNVRELAQEWSFLQLRRHGIAVVIGLTDE